MINAAERPMFPLGVAHLPGDVVTLRIFEPRYVAMVRDLLAGDEMRFGSVLITAGSEVGGGERRANHGVLVSIRDCAVTAEGGYALLGSAEEVISVVEWLPDGPYPRARVAASPAADMESRRGEIDRLGGAVVRLAQGVRILLERSTGAGTADGGGRLPPREVLFALRSMAAGNRPGVTSPSATTAGAELESAVWLLARAVPCGPLDRLTLLATADLGMRVRALEAIVEHVSEILEFGH